MGTYIGPDAVVTVAGASGAAVFTASGPTGEDTYVELLIQPLLNAKRSPTQLYELAAFVSFVSGSLTHSIPLQKGWNAAAYRFVERPAGHTSLMQPLGKLEIL